MYMSKITIHRALSELKLLDARINRGIYDLNVVGVRKNTAPNVNGTKLTPELFAAKAKADLDSVKDLVMRRDAIKRAIVLSNASTMVSIGDVEYTVAEAIERKTSIQYDKALLRKLKSLNSDAMSAFNRGQEQMEAALDKQLQAMGGSDKTAKADGLLAFAEGYRAQNGFELIDPLTVVDYINGLQTSIDVFEMEVDSVLSESNATTFIEV